MWSIANAWEKNFHGTPSGIDTGLVLYQHLTQFRGASERLPSHRSIKGQDFYLIVGGVPRNGNTKTLVSRLGRRIQRKDSATCEAMKRLGGLSTQAVRLIQNCSSNSISLSLGALATEAHIILKNLGLSSKILEQMMQTGLDTGATGGKLSGAGGGGAFYLVCPSRTSVAVIGQALKKACRQQSNHFPVFGIRVSSKQTKMITV